jgi:hypothetical protein
VYTCVTTQVDSSLTDLYTGYWSPSHDNLCCFKVSVLVPLNFHSGNKQHMSSAENWNFLSSTSLDPFSSYSLEIFSCPKKYICVICNQIPEIFTCKMPMTLWLWFHHCYKIILLYPELHLNELSDDWIFLNLVWLEKIDHPTVSGCCIFRLCVLWFLLICLRFFKT